MVRHRIREKFICSKSHCIIFNEGRAVPTMYIGVYFTKLQTLKGVGVFRQLVEAGE